MNQFTGFECAVCGALKRETNHWWLVFVLLGVDLLLLQRSLAVTEWRSDIAGNAGYRPTCGCNCTQKLVERWLTTSSLDAPRGAAGNPVERHTA